jgi:predicted AlkP superfamily pyrophosphatase or phosphodiesterase
MKLKYLSLALLALTTLNTQAQTKKNAPVASTSVARPKLVVGIVIDQMRWDYLYRYYDRYQNNGFKRMLNEGFSCDNTNLDYVPTVTAAGHSCIYTGTVPSIHGIAGNDFIIQATGKSMYCTEDSTVKTVGSTSVAGQMSPRNLLTTTVTDELRLATNFRSKVIGISLKDRGGILPAGHSANAAYWFDDLTGNWITSTYYMADLPAWVKNVNSQKLAEKYLKQDWNTLYPISTYLQSTEDNSPRYEGAPKGATEPTMPVKTSNSFAKGYSMIRSTPYGNSITLDMARAAIDNEKLGKNTVTDFLAVSLSSTDYIGHQYGINAVETEDTYLRLDRDLGAFFTYLDNTVGKGNYTVFLTADHGAAHNPTFLTDHGVPAGVWASSGILKELNNQLSEKYGIKNTVLSFMNYQVNLNNIAIADKKVSEYAIKQDCIAFLKKQDGVEYVVDMQSTNNTSIPEALRLRIVNGYNADRSGAIQIILKPGWFSEHGATGTTHGTWNPYDTHIPLVFMGWGIPHGHTNASTHMTDIAPTVAALLHIQTPNGAIGLPILEIVK